MKKKLLIVDENKKMRKEVLRIFKKDFDIFEASDEQEAYRVYNSELPDVVFLEINFNFKPRGWDIFHWIREHRKKAVVVVITSDEEQALSPQVNLADGFLTKPVYIEHLKELLRKKGVF